MTEPLTEKEAGVALIAAERARQIEQEHWTPEHDDSHRDGELARAAAAYALPSGPGYESRWAIWPWRDGSFKPTGERLDELIKAGALIAAEIDRLTRQREQP